MNRRYRLLVLFVTAAMFGITSVAGASFMQATASVPAQAPAPPAVAVVA